MRCVCTRLCARCVCVCVPCVRCVCVCVSTRIEVCVTAVDATTEGQMVWRGVCLVTGSLIFPPRRRQFWEVGFHCLVPRRGAVQPPGECLRRISPARDRAVGDGDPAAGATDGVPRRGQPGDIDLFPSWPPGVSWATGHARTQTV